MGEFEILSEPKLENYRYLMVRCATLDCNWVMFVETVNRGRNIECERCHEKHAVPVKIIPIIAEEKDDEEQPVHSTATASSACTGKSPHEKDLQPGDPEGTDSDL